jgi:hypothetical protein
VAGPNDVLSRIIAMLRESETLLSEHLREPDAEPGLGLLAAAGPRARGAEADYAFVVEAIREGYLLHYGEPRIVTGADRDLALLAGDHLYALGLERLAALGDLEAVRELADLISLSAQLHADGGDPPAARGATLRAADALWLGTVTAITAGAGDAHVAAKRALGGDGESGAAAEALAGGARDTAAVAGIGAALERAADSIDFDLPDSPAG